MKLLLIITTHLVATSYLYAVDNLRLSDMRSMGMGENGVTQSLFFNPALFVETDCKTIHLDYFNQYGIKELGTISTGFFFPNTVLSTGVNISSFGYDAYRESMFRLLLGKQLNEKWRIGISIQYSLLQTELLEEQPKRLSTDIGALFCPVDKLLIGMLIMHLPSVSIGNKTSEIKDFTVYSIQIGFQWEVINSLLIAGSLDSNKEYTLSGGMGVEYTPFNNFRIRAGIKATPFLPTLGVGYSLSKFTVDIATIYHPVLGMSTGMGLKYSF